MKLGLRRVATDLFFYCLGAALYSAAVTLLLTPNAVSAGGITGIATVLHVVYGLPSGLMVWLLNIPILIVGFLKMGGLFIVKTGIVTVISGLFLDLCERFLTPIKTDSILACVFGGLLMGTGISLVLFRGATTGGVDIIAKLINLRHSHITVGKIILIADVFVIALTAAVYKNIESALYSVIALYASSRVTDTVLYGSDKGKIIYIVTNAPEEIGRAINGTVGRGVTKLAAIGGYTGQSRVMLMCIVRPHEVGQVNAIIREHDRAAFTVISDAGEIIGEGFKK